MSMGSVIRYWPGSSKTRTLNQKVETSLLSYLIRLLRQELNPRPKARYLHFYTIWLISAASKIMSVCLFDLMKMLALAKT